MADKEKNQEVETKEEESVESNEDVLDDANSSETEEESELKKCKDELKAWEDKYLRMHAEFENIKKRMEREKEKSVAYAQEQFARDLLPVIDSLELALSSIPDTEDGNSEHLAKLKEGVQLTLEQFVKTFEKHHIKVIEIDGGFDPNFHDAVMQVDSDEHESGQIVQVLQKGYMYKERLLRPAMVSVAK
ncbi:nucleotide exchange factor GrpE [Hydrogenimonas thermophila]|uniref:Protein GrpE n=1 Tax=Hydrogenimonas thermophila TaxID=223786 RepID=A0A1I5SR20_9BACT|nr:nucleotide exchange factor GrpE [Hydrogenimonas thermophila]SFP73179.1 molecular chaperone GrpE [Hydrogenimonas thermophila]